MKTLLYTLSVLLLSSCASTITLKKSDIDRFQLSDHELEMIQFYNTQDIILTRLAATNANKQTQNGKLKLEGSRGTEQIVIKAGTAGKVVEVLPKNKLALAFDSDESKRLVFGTKNNGDSYELLAPEWRDQRGKIQYGEHYYLTNEQADKCGLAYKLKRKYEVKNEVQLAKGNKVK